MIYNITISSEIHEHLRSHLFQNQLEQGAFLFSHINRSLDTVNFQVVRMHPITKEGWETQLEVYLEMKDAERAKIMQIARSQGFAVIDCHSHPDSGTQVAFSPSDKNGITEFAQYAKWKLNNLPFAAMVWGEQSVDAIAWDGMFKEPYHINGIYVSTNPLTIIHPQNSWWPKLKRWGKSKRYGRL